MGALEGHCEVFCGSFDVDDLVDELPVCGGVGGCQLIAAALCFEGEAAVLVGGGLRHDLAFAQERDLCARHGGLVGQHDAALYLDRGHHNDACRDGRSRAHADEDSGTAAATATAARGRAAAGGRCRSRSLIEGIDAGSDDISHIICVQSRAARSLEALLVARRGGAELVDIDEIFRGKRVDLRPAHDNGIAHAWRQIAERGGEAVVVTGGGGGEDAVFFGGDGGGIAGVVMPGGI